MYAYARYCPVSSAARVVGDSWSPLIIRELLYGTDHFNQLIRNVPGISRTVLATRLRALERAGVLQCERTSQANLTRYRLTEAGRNLSGVIEAMDARGSRWGGSEEAEECQDLDPLVMICMLKSRVRCAELPDTRVVLEVLAVGEQQATAWLVCERQSISVCFEPGDFDTDLWVRADVSTLYNIWKQHTTMTDALACGRVQVDGSLQLIRSFSNWF